jgi:uncharacterized protein (TIGR03437 family)
MQKVLMLALALSLSLAAQSVETIPYRVQLSSLNEVPALSGDASTGTATILAHVVRDAAGEIVSGSVDFKVNYKLGATTNITAMHIHRGSAASNGPVVIDSTLSSAIADATSGTLRLQGQAQPTATTALTALRDLVKDPAGFYLNLHTTKNPAGEMRGQLLPAENLVLIGLMNEGNEVPATGVTAKGVCTIQVIAARRPDGLPLSAEVIFDMNYTPFAADTIFTGFHIHNGVAGAIGPVVINTGMTNPTPAAANGGNLRYEVQIDPTNTTQSLSTYGLFADPSQFYVNIHTTVNAGGAIRSQLRRTDKMKIDVTMLPSNEVPAITGLEATAYSSLTLHTLRNNDGWVVAGYSLWDANVRFPATTQFTGLHIHEGGAAENGPVILNSNLSASNSSPVEGGFGNIYRSATQSSDTAIRAMNTISGAPHTTYYNLHTSTNTGGAVRAQTVAVPANPVITAVISAVDDPTKTTVSPQGLFTVFGSNLFSFASNNESYDSAAPMQLNSSTVTIGGKKAAIVAMNRVKENQPTDVIVAQVPVDAANGNAAVVVSTYVGSSNEFTVPVATVAPGLYFDKVGGIVFHVSDMTLVRPDYPAVVGEPIAILSTGLGRTIPPVATGQILPADALSVTFPSPSVTIGGKAAAVTGAGVVPGFVGFYLVVAAVPAGVSGTVPVVVTQGTVSSNSVTMTVQ